MSEGPEPNEAAPERTQRRWSRQESGTARARSTVRGVLGFQLLANGLGLSVILLYVSLLFPAGNNEQESALNLKVFGVYLAINLLIGLPVNLLLLRRAVVWVREGTEATARQRWLVLRLPLLETATALVSWFGGAVLFGIVNESARRVSVGIALAGVVTCTLLYLLLEGHFRPVFALALRNADLPEGRRDVWPRLMLAWLLGSGMPIALLGVAPLLDERFELSRLPWIAGFGLLGGGAVMTTAAISVSGRSTACGPCSARWSRAISTSTSPSTTLVSSVVSPRASTTWWPACANVSSCAISSAARWASRARAARRRQRRLRRRRRTARGHGAVRRPAGYTRFSETSSPEAVVAMLNRFFRIVVAAVNREGGWVNKFEGDAALCVFGAPQEDVDHAANALRAAEALRRDLSRSDEGARCRHRRRHGHGRRGFIGTPERYEYTVIGNCVNLASRLCDLAKEERSGVLAAFDTWHEAGGPEGWVESVGCASAVVPAAARDDVGDGSQSRRR